MEAPGDTHRFLFSSASVNLIAMDFAELVLFSLLLLSVDEN